MRLYIKIQDEFISPIFLFYFLDIHHSENFPEAIAYDLKDRILNKKDDLKVIQAINENNAFFKIDDVDIKEVGAEKIIFSDNNMSYLNNLFSLDVEVIEALQADRHVLFIILNDSFFIEKIKKFNHPDLNTILAVLASQHQLIVPVDDTPKSIFYYSQYIQFFNEVLNYCVDTPEAYLLFRKIFSKIGFFQDLLLLQTCYFILEYEILISFLNDILLTNDALLFSHKITLLIAYLKLHPQCEDDFAVFLSVNLDLQERLFNFFDEMDLSQEEYHDHRALKEFLSNHPVLKTDVSETDEELNENDISSSPVSAADLTPASSDKTDVSETDEELNENDISSSPVTAADLTFAYIVFDVAVTVQGVVLSIGLFSFCTLVLGVPIVGLSFLPWLLIAAAAGGAPGLLLASAHYYSAQNENHVASFFKSRAPDSASYTGNSAYSL